MKRSLQGLLAAALFLSIASGLAWAQATAQLNGRVTDESGAVLPGVTVTATQTDTAFTRTVVTDETGSWAMPNLPIGPYRLEVSLQGFRTYVQTGIVLQVNANPVITTALAIGNLEETVSVEAAAPLVDVRSAGISEVVEQERLVELPLQGRQVTDLIVLAGSAVNEGTLSALSNSGSVAISVAGGLRNGVEYTLDGAMHNNTYDNVNLPFPFPDALQEFRVATGGLSAENGMHSAAAVNAVVKSGTNNLHGNAFEFLRDGRFNASSVFAAGRPRRQEAGDGLNRNQFGGTVGGPIDARQALFLRRIPAHALPPDAARPDRFRAHRRDAGGRFHRRRVGGVQRRPAGDAARAIRQQPDRPVTAQSGGGQDRDVRVPAGVHRSVRRDQIQRAAREQ